MSNRTTLLATGTILAVLVIAALLVFAEEPDAVGAPEVPAQESAPTLVARGVRAADAAVAEPEVEAAEVTREAVATSATTGSLLVKVLWSGGDLAPRVGVAFQAAATGMPRTVYAREISDERGEIRVLGLPAGELMLRSDRGGDMDVEVVAGSEQEYEFTQPVGIPVHGVVVDRGERLVAGASVWLQTYSSAWTGGRVIAQTGADGSFALEEIPDGLSLGAVADGYAPSGLVDLDVVDTTSPPVSVRLVLEDGAGTVAGRVASVGGEPIEGAIVAVGEIARSGDYRGGDRWAENWTPRVSSSDAEGHFVITGIKTGVVPVAARTEDYGLWRGEVEVVDGERAWVDVTLAETGVVAGTVTDQNGEVIGGAVVRAYDMMPRTPFVIMGQIDFDKTFGHVATRSDERGRYRLAGVTPGEVHLFAQNRNDYRLDQVVPYVNASLEVEPGAEVEWNPVITPGRSIEGVVLYQDGHPMLNVFVTARDEDSGQQHVMINNREGVFRFVGLTGSTYSVHVQYRHDERVDMPLEMAGVAPDRGRVELRASFPKPVEQEAGVVVGRFDDTGGRVDNEKALQMHLMSEHFSWRPGIEVVEGAYRVEDVKPGRYHVIAMLGETAIAQGDWFEVGEAEVHDAGVLRTELPGVVVIELERSEGAQEIEVSLSLVREGKRRGASVTVGRGTEVRVDNLTPGKYEVTGWATGMRMIEGEVEVRVGETSELGLEVVAAVQMRFEVWYPRDWGGGKSTLRVVGEDGVLWEYEPTHGVPPRPFETPVNVPRGRWTVEVSTEDGLSGSTEFVVDALDREYPVVRVDLN